jgi:hypothetical protein
MKPPAITTWRKELEDAFRKTGDTWGAIEASTLTTEQLDTEFDPDYGGTEGASFTVWTRNYVYFPACYDGAEWVAWVSRNPDAQPTSHIGGG